LLAPITAIDRARSIASIALRGASAALIIVRPRPSRYRCRALPGHPVDHRFDRHDLDRHVGEHELDGLEIADRAAELHAPGSVVVGYLRRPDRRADAMAGDLQASLDEPVFGQLEPAADRAEDGVVIELDILENELGMLGDEIVHEFRGALHPDAGLVLVDEKQRGFFPVAVD
jgi:hypothetical protein